MSLYDYGLGTLAQYELTADRSARTRGALLCYTAQGLLILREFPSNSLFLSKSHFRLMYSSFLIRQMRTEQQNNHARRNGEQRRV